MASPLLIGTITVGGLLLLAGPKKSAGTGLVYISDFLRARGQIAGVSFITPSSASAVETFGAMRDAQQGKWGESGGYPNAPGLTELHDICQAWLDAFSGACAQNSGAATGSVFDAGKFNLSMLVQRLGGAAVPPTCSLDACGDSKLSGALSPLGHAVCALQSHRDAIIAQGWSGENDNAEPFVSEVYARVERLATELDAADYAVPGTRPSDTLTSIGDIPGEIAGFLASAFLGSPIVWAIGLGLVGYLVLR